MESMFWINHHDSWYIVYILRSNKTGRKYCPKAPRYTYQKWANKQIKQIPCGVAHHWWMQMVQSLYPANWAHIKSYLPTRNQGEVCNHEPMKGEQWLNKSIQTQTLESFAGGLARPWPTWHILSSILGLGYSEPRDLNTLPHAYVLSLGYWRMGNAVYCPLPCRWITRVYIVADYTHVDDTLMWWSSFMILPLLNVWALVQSKQPGCWHNSAVLWANTEYIYVCILFFSHKNRHAHNKSHTELMQANVNTTKREVCLLIAHQKRPPSWTVGSPAAEKAAQMAYFVSWRLYASTTWGTCWAVDYMIPKAFKKNNEPWILQTASYSISWILRLRRLLKAYMVTSFWTVWSFEVV